MAEAPHLCLRRLCACKAPTAVAYAQHAQQTAHPGSPRTSAPLSSVPASSTQVVDVV